MHTYAYLYTFHNINYIILVWKCCYEENKIKIQFILIIVNIKQYSISIYKISLTFIYLLCADLVNCLKICKFEHFKNLVSNIYNITKAVEIIIYRRTMSFKYRVTQTRRAYLDLNCTIVSTVCYYFILHANSVT